MYAVWRVLSRSCSTASARRGHEIARSPLPDGVAARYLIPLGVTCIDEGRHSHSRIKVPADIVKSSNVLPASSLRRSTHKHGRQRQRSGDWAAQRTVPAGSHGRGQRQNRSCQTVRNSGHKGDLAATHRCRYVGIGVLTQSREHVLVIYPIAGAGERTQEQRNWPLKLGYAGRIGQSLAPHLNTPALCPQPPSPRYPLQSWTLPDCYLTDRRRLELTLQVISPRPMSTSSTSPTNSSAAFPHSPPRSSASGHGCT